MYSPWDVKILERLRHRFLPEHASAASSPETSSPDEQQLPIAGYDGLEGKEIIPSLPELSQVDLAAVEGHERAHRERPAVLNRLRWLRGSEPLPSYDTLESGEIVRALADADTATLKAVRSYERHHRARRAVTDEVVRLLPGAQESAGEVRARDQKTALVRAGIRSRPGATSSPADRADPARDARNELEQLRDEARYRRERLELYRARLYGGRSLSQAKLTELQRAADGAAARLERAEAAPPAPRAP